MAANPDVTTSVDESTASATVVIDAPAEAIFDFIRRPANHSVISGDGTVQGSTKGPDVLSMGDRFGMSMRMGVPYRISSKVVEFEDGKRIAWCHISGHRWRWELEPVADGKTRVTETYDQSTARAPFVLRAMGYPKRHEANVEKSVTNVAEHFATAPS